RPHSTTAFSRFNLGSGQVTSVADTITTAEKATGRPSPSTGPPHIVPNDDRIRRPLVTTALDAHRGADPQRGIRKPHTLLQTRHCARSHLPSCSRTPRRAHLMTRART